jgi:excisionase family DNA binding protein
MADDVLSIEQVAERLGLHVRTVRRYVREGRLKAVRIGKQYRVARAALAELTGSHVSAASGGPHAGRHIEVSSILQVDGIDAGAANRVTTGLLSAVNGRSDPADPLRIDTIYDPSRARLKVILTGSVDRTVPLLKFVRAYLETE